METIHDSLSTQFLAWESRGRGWAVHPHAVRLEPVCPRFDGYTLEQRPDDGKRPTFLASAVRGLSTLLQGRSDAPDIGAPIEEREEVIQHERGSLGEIELSVPKGLKYQSQINKGLLSLLRRTEEPVSFELVSDGSQITTVFAGAEPDIFSLRRSLETFLPEVSCLRREASPLTAFTDPDAATVIIEFGYLREWLHRLGEPNYDPLISIISALETLRPGEKAVYQALFEPCVRPWRESLLTRLGGEQGKPVFANAAYFLPLTREKCREPLFSVVVRLAVSTGSFDRSADLLSVIAPSLTTFDDPEGNELVPLSNEDYAWADHVEDLILRQSRRTGMLMGLSELAALVHAPSAEVRSTKLARERRTTKAAPRTTTSPGGVCLGVNKHAGEEVSVFLSEEARIRHTYIVGASGTGKSTLLLNLITQDLGKGHGLGVIDPHGDLIDSILSRIPNNRVQDVVLIDPSDAEYAVGFNILKARDEFEKTLLASDVVSIFQRISTSWGDQLGTVFRAAVLAFLESEQGGTLVELRQFLTDPAFRASFLRTVNDEDVVAYWQKTFPLLSGNKSVGPILTRLEMFLSQKSIRDMVSQREKALDFAELMDSRKIVLAKLSQGLLGRENSQLLGSLFMSKFQQAAMARQRLSHGERAFFALYADEFQDYITPSLAEIISGARKYQLGLTLAHQELQQLEKVPEVASAVRNAYTHLCFRVSDRDAKALEKGFSSFTAHDLQNLGIGEAICKLERAEVDFNLEVKPQTGGELNAAERAAVIQASREQWATPRKPRSAQSNPAVARDAVPTPPRPEPKPEPTRIIPPIAVAPIIPKHQALKENIAAAARKNGFVVYPEKPVVGGKGRIDLVLERDQTQIACEVSYTTPIGNEVVHVERCLEDGYTHVAVVCEDIRRLELIRTAVTEAVPLPEIGRVRFYAPDEFLAHLTSSDGQAVSPSIPTAAPAFAPLSEPERKLKEADLLRRLAENMRKKRKPS